MPQLVPGHDLAVLQEEQGEDSKGLFLEFDPYSLARHCSTCEIYFEEAKSHRNSRMDLCFGQSYPHNSTGLPDQIRADELLREMGEFEKTGKLPNLMVITMATDHTNGTRPGVPTARRSNVSFTASCTSA